MKRLFLLPCSALGLVAFAVLVPRGTTAQEQFPFETQLERWRMKSVELDDSALRCDVLGWCQLH